MSGHSKWTTIKLEEDAYDPKRGQLLTLLIKELTSSSRQYDRHFEYNPQLPSVIGSDESSPFPANTHKVTHPEDTRALPAL